MSEEKRHSQPEKSEFSITSTADGHDKHKAVRSREAELDDFWDISALIPPKKNPPPRAQTSISLTEIVSDPQNESVAGDRTQLTRRSPHATHGNGSPPDSTNTSAPVNHNTPTEERDTVITRYIPPHTRETAPQTPSPDDEYTPQGGMLHRVRIYHWKTTYQYYEEFCCQAAALYSRHGEPCAPIPFFSYVPQYAQMSRAQLNWYLYWRDGMRRGEVMSADYSYILLYIYEIINLADTVDVHVGQDQLCLLWQAFRGTYPRLGHLLGEWICDYSLIHHLPPPPLADLSAVSDCTLKEFYVPNTEASDRYARALMAFGSNYIYTKSKFAVGDNRPLYDKHMPGALCACIADEGEVGRRMMGAGLEESRLIRDAYTGALCSHRVKRRIEIDYCSFARSHELRILVTDIMKYTENRLRAYLGVKSRLGLYALPQVFRDCIDRYLRAALPAKERAPQAAPRQEYEALYDVPATAFSAARAAEIEANSWDTTERLIAAFGETEETKIAETTVPPRVRENDTTAQEDETVSTRHVSSESSGQMSEKPPVADVPTGEEACSDHEEIPLLLDQLGELRVFVCSALRRDTAAQRTFARARGEMLDSIADRINEIAADVLGDVLLEEGDDGGYTVIDEYQNMFEPM